MRHLAQIEGKQQAEAFVAYLLTQSIATHIEAVPENGQLWDVWIRDEDALSRARAELTQFLANPADPKYSAAIPQARQIIKEKLDASRAAVKNVRPVKYRGPTATGITGGRIPPLTLTLMLLCIATSLVTNFTKPKPTNRLGQTTIEQLSFVSARDYERDQDPAASLKRGQVWRAITPVFVHGSPMHLAMNMIGLVVLGRIAERLVGTPRFALMFLLLAALPMMLACLMPMSMDGSPRTFGISGVDYGLAAYLWIVSQQRPDLGFRLPGSFIAILLVFILLGFSGLVPGVSSWAHLGGFVTGLLLAFADTARR